MTAEKHQNGPEVIALTADWLVLFKPAGWLTIPGRESGPSASGVLLEWARERHGGVLVVHRLDRETSGVVLFARTAKGHREACLQFQNHRVRKAYDCLARGVPRMPVLKLNQPIEGAPSVTQVEVLESYHEGFLARVMPLTGRRHQIRIHLSKEGHPLWGDTRYGGPSSVEVGGLALGIPRVALHAAKLELPGGEKFEAPWPRDFESWVARLREGGRRV